METNEIAVDMLNEEQVQALNLVQNTNFSFFLTGKAGTGKTTFLHYIQKNVDKQFVVVAPTGVAAILAGGVTIHSFFGMPFDPITPMTEFQINHDKQVMLRHVDTIIIDEVSMVRCDLIDGIDRILRKVMHNSHPFGGKQIIFSGDLYQLEPVIDRHDEGLMQFFREKYNTGKAYFYEANVFTRLKLPRIEFKKVYRQTDTRYLSILDHIRSGKYSPTELMLLNTNGLRTMQNSPKDTLTLCALNDTADSINTSHLSAIEKREIIYMGVVNGDFTNRRFPVQQELILKEGARVMFCRNDRNHRWVNGTVGTVASLTDKSICVSLDNGNICDVEPVTWENVAYTYNAKTKSLDKEIIGTYTQYPLKLAWAITIHKSQGMTFDRMNVDFSKGTFMPGQLYVALQCNRKCHCRCI
ncbi:MAG: ATP-dependent RecD-like DNA helicase, partial [Agathobacter sp.]